MFEPIEVEWQGKSKELAEDRIMTMLARVEEKITFGETCSYIDKVQQSGVRHQIKVAAAYTEMLRCFGFKVGIEDVLKTLDADGYLQACLNLAHVLKYTLSPAERERFDNLMAGAVLSEDDDEEGQAPPDEDKEKPGKSKAASPGSKKRTGGRSAPGT